MTPTEWTTLDANEAVASVAYRASEVIAIYPITPASPMGEHCDEWSTARRPNLWNAIPEVVEMQAEGGAAGAIHGAVQAGALGTTFTASQGLLLMIPNMYKIAGELTPFVMHVASRTVATHALSIFGDHSDVMACRQTGFALLASGSVQEAQDLAAIAHAATLESRIPFLHFFDGFRTSHEVNKIATLDDEALRGMVDESLIAAHRARALTPDHPVLRGTAQNPDTFFQAREAGNSYYLAAPAIVRHAMERFARLTGRSYAPFDYVGHPEAERVVVVMGSAAETAHETAEWLAVRGEKVGVLKVRLYRPFSAADFFGALPATVRAIAVLDRTKEPGALGEPLYEDVVTAFHEARQAGDLRFAREPVVIGGRYGLSSKEFSPAAAKAVFDELARERPRPHFTVGITDDVTHLSLALDHAFEIEPEDTTRAVFFGLGADGTVSANKNSIKIIGEQTPLFAQGYFVYDSKKSGAITISHLRFGPRPIRSSHLIRRANFVACHQPRFLDRYDVLDQAAPGATFLLNSPQAPGEVWDALPLEVQAAAIEKRIRLFAIDAARVARDAQLGGRINTIMQTCFFALSGVIPRDEAIAKIKAAIAKTYAKRGEEIVERNFAAVDAALANLHEIAVPAHVTATRTMPPIVPGVAPDFVQRVTAVMLAGKGDGLPVSAFPVDGTWPLGTARWEKRDLAVEIPQWDPGICIQCNKCALVCPHAVIRAKVYAPEQLDGAPTAFRSMPFKAREAPALRYTIQVAPEDCTGCGLCVAVCPAKDRSNPRHKAIDMVAQAPIRQRERSSWEFFQTIREADRTSAALDVKESQFREPLFEFSGACAGCGETPYIKLLTQLFGDRLLIANATGCSSIYGGNLPTTPYATNRDGRGPAWSNSLFEDNAEFGLGFRLAVDRHEAEARTLLAKLGSRLGDTVVAEILSAETASEAAIARQRDRVAAVRRALAKVDGADARRLDALADYLIKKAVWIVGGDGWAYDIGYGGLDHVLSLGRKVNVLVLDTEVYSNTGGQQSKATPIGASAKFAIAGKALPKKDLGLMAMVSGNTYVARVAFGAKDAQTVKAMLEAESYPGPSIVIAMSPCIAHGYDLVHGADQQKLAVASGYWPLYRFDPRRLAAGQNPLELDSPPPHADLGAYMRNESRFRMVEDQDPARYRTLLETARQHNRNRVALYEQLAKLAVPFAPAGAPGASAPLAAAAAKKG